MNLKNLKVTITGEAHDLLTKYIDEKGINQNDAIDRIIKKQLGQNDKKLIKSKFVGDKKK